MLLFIALVALGLGVGGYSVGLNFRAIRAERAGEIDRAGALRQRAVLIGLGVTFTWVILFLLLLLVRGLT